MWIFEEIMDDSVLEMMKFIDLGVFWIISYIYIRRYIYRNI